MEAWQLHLWESGRAGDDKGERLALLQRRLAALAPGPVKALAGPGEEGGGRLDEPLGFERMVTVACGASTATPTRCGPTPRCCSPPSDLSAWEQPRPRFRAD
jgi:hypothetical protein